MDNLIQLSLSDFFQRESCPYCSSRKNKLLGPVMFQRFFSTPQGKVMLNNIIQQKRQLVKCSSCGVVYHQIIPRKETMDKLYQSSNVLENWEWNPIARGFQSKFGFMLNNPHSKIRILDVGCHTGGFLSLLPKNWEKYGIDPNSVALGKARQRIPNGTFRSLYVEDIDLPPNYFNIITMWDIAEHLYDVQNTFQNIYTLLAQGGYLVLETGNWVSLSARIFRRGWYYVNLLEHFVFFEPSTIQRVLKENGLVVEQIKTTVHHKKKKTCRRNLKSLLYAVLTAGGTVAFPWLEAAKWKTF